ncbi:hypothetical protein GCM10007862_07310 [Dyella lipolytica]|uniref:Uncharacterized protein n=1 Tax=Dyella lipolytica TaxID=1867835 RepID=A0ABW8IYE7_9GAMM|nr:hypothetical protein [Dyella lipolytica]GLQ45680.1 hypothetical protein GCM10007862_07310 [Dyella lipolytica]
MEKDSWDIALVILTGVGALFTGVAAVATAFAARGAFKAADVALDIASRQAEWEQRLSSRRAEVHAGFIYKQIVIVRGFAADMESAANEMVAAARPDNLASSGSQLNAKASQLDASIDAIRPENIAELPEICAADTAVAISDARYTVQLARAVWEKSRSGNSENQATAKRLAGVVKAHCADIQNRLESYLVYARERFGEEY